MTDCDFDAFDIDDINELFKEEQRINEEVENALDQLTDELNGLRQIVRNLVRYGDQCLEHVPLTFQLDEIIAQARALVAKHGYER